MDASRRIYHVLIALGILLSGAVSCLPESVVNLESPGVPTSVSFFTTAAPGRLEITPRSTSVPGHPPAVLLFDPSIQTVEDLRGLPIRKFFDESYRLLLLRSPQKVTELGLSSALGIRDDRLDDLSDEAVKETQALEKEILLLLRTYPRQQLSAVDRVSYDTYSWYLETQVNSHPCADYKFELTDFINGYPFILEQLFTELHPMETFENTQDFLARLEGVDGQVDGLLSSLRRRAVLGILPPRYMLQAARRYLQSQLGSSSPDPQDIEPGGLKIYTHFSTQVATMHGLSDDQKAALIEKAALATQDSLIPAYLQLIEFIDEFEGKASDEAGLWKFPQGQSCYQLLLDRETSTKLTAEQVHSLGLAEVERVRLEIEGVLDGLPYLKDLSLNERLRMAQDDLGYIDLSSSQGKEKLAESYTQLLQQMDGRLNAYFVALPSQELNVLVDENCWAAYYVPASLDGSRHGAFHSCVGGRQMPRSSMPTIAYHEGLPGHHFQIALSRQLDLPLFRHDIPLNGYVEGWALYAERLAWEMGMYEDDPHGDLGRLQYELLRAARLVVDTGIHMKKWTRQEAQAYLNRSVGGFEYEADRYVAMPAQATSYMVGMLKIIELRKKAEETLGEQFDLAEFHQVILSSGSLPLEVLELIVNEYLLEKAAQPQ